MIKQDYHHFCNTGKKNGTLARNMCEHGGYIHVLELSAF
jgi:hypothetical protein